ncbi:MAG TPA: ATP-dependent DNA ligase [Streptosporangiaceae bacterium]|nr:ATP-dependent DNA ligase [Streptosporangiaceae bacterium]
MPTKRSPDGDGADVRDGVPMTNLGQPLFDGAAATKGDLVDYLDAVRDRLVPELADRPLSVMRVRPGQAPFMQKNVPKYAPPWLRTVALWAESSQREVSYALCNDRRTLLWFANQRAVEYHPTLIRADAWNRPTYMVLDIDPPAAEAFALAVQAAHLVRRALSDAGLAGAVKTSGAKGVHVFVPVGGDATIEEVAAATRALAARAERLDPALATTAFIREDRAGKVFIDSTRAGGATVVAAYSPRIRPGTPVSFPVPWDELDGVAPADFTLHTAARSITPGATWADLLPEPRPLPADLIEEGHAIPIARVQAMHEGKRRARARRTGNADPPDPPAG